MKPPHYRAVPQSKGVYLIEYRKNAQTPYSHFGTVIKWSSGFVSFDGNNYKSIPQLLHALEKEKK